MASLHFIGHWFDMLFYWFLELFFLFSNSQESLVKGVEKSPVLAGYKYFLAIKWPVFHVLLDFRGR